MDKIIKTNQQWLTELDPETYRVTREKGTERPYTGKYNQHKAIGTYLCVCCGQPLFRSDVKFDSGCGWPSFFEPLDKALVEHMDTSHGMVRTEVVCSRCDAHLGHVFSDGPEPTGLRYCINSVCLDFSADVVDLSQKEKE